MSKENCDKLVDTDLSHEHLYPISFKSVKMELNFTPGSTESIDFHKQLGQT